MLYLLVDCNKILEGTLKNIVERDIRVKSIKSIDIVSTLLPAEPEKSKDTVKTPAVRPLKEILTSEEKDLLEYNDDKGNARGTADAGEESHPNEPLYSPDLIIYQTESANKGDFDTVMLLRKSCSFRDVPILVATTLSQLEEANKLIPFGASETFLFPQKPETIVKLLKKIMSPVGERIPVSTELINPFISATLDLMKVMAGMQVAKKGLFLKKDYRLFGDVSGIMNFTGNIEGSVVVSFSEDLARTVIGKIMSCDPNALPESEIKGGVGEIVNIISGNAKAALAHTEYSHRITLPTVVTGYGHEIKHMSNAPCIVVIFEADNRSFAVQVCMAPMQK